MIAWVRLSFILAERLRILPLCNVQLRCGVGSAASAADGLVAAAGMRVLHRAIAAH